MGIGVRDMIGPHQPVIQLCPMPPWQPLQAYHGTQIVHALSPIVQAPACYLPTSMVYTEPTLCLYRYVYMHGIFICICTSICTYYIYIYKDITSRK